MSGWLGYGVGFSGVTIGRLLIVREMGGKAGCHFRRARDKNMSNQCKSSMSSI